MPDVLAYTDGGCRGNPGPGGWACLIIDPRTHDALERSGGEGATTNNRMEILAAIMALRSLKKPGTAILIHSDSQYVIKAASEWIPGWKARGWKRKDGPLKNVDLLQEIDGLLAQHRVTWQWVKGHDGNPGNERVDALANQAMDTIARGGDPTFEQRVRWH
ncbi:MAG: ribonuclease HI [Planctomycetes bacterium]|nr:ribonuclease HI [Planctomycetota bacterium]